jgi:hypothetical protein
MPDSPDRTSSRSERALRRFDPTWLISPALPFNVQIFSSRRNANRSQFVKNITNAEFTAKLYRTEATVQRGLKTPIGYHLRIVPDRTGPC